jgi:hypothetical protein
VFVGVENLACGNKNCKRSVRVNWTLHFNILGQPAYPDREIIIMNHHIKNGQIPSCTCMNVSWFLHGIWTPSSSFHTANFAAEPIKQINKCHTSHQLNRWWIPCTPLLKPHWPTREIIQFGRISPYQDRVLKFSQ